MTERRPQFRGTSEYARRFPLKTRAQDAIQRELRAGRIQRLPCQECGNPKVEAHHPDYAKPLDVLFLCRKHHRAWHREHGQGLNGGDAPLQRVHEEIDLRGQRIGRLEVLSLKNGAELTRDRIWSCRCDCGKVFSRQEISLVRSRGSLWAACRACCAEVVRLGFTTRANTFAVLHRFGLGLYGERALEQMRSDIRDEVARALGVRPTVTLDPDVSFSVSDGYDWGSASVLENLDSFELPPDLRVKKRFTPVPKRKAA